MVEPDAWTGSGHWNRWLCAVLAEALYERRAGKTHNQAIRKYAYRDGLYVWQHTESRVPRERRGSDSRIECELAFLALFPAPPLQIPVAKAAQKGWTFNSS